MDQENKKVWQLRIICKSVVDGILNESRGCYEVDWCSDLRRKDYRMNGTTERCVDLYLEVRSVGRRVFEVKENIVRFMMLKGGSLDD